MDFQVHLKRIKNYKLVRMKFYDIKLHKDCFFYYKKIDLRSRLIYKHTNKINGMCYIGQCIIYNNKLNHCQTMTRRYQGHCDDAIKHNSSCVFHQAIREFGLENFDHEIIDQFIPNVKETNEAEKYWIELYDCLVPNGYNMTKGGEGQSGHSPTLETREKMRQANEGKPLTNTRRNNISKATKGRKLTQEHKNNIKKVLSNRSPEIYVKIAESNRGKKHPHSQETKDKLSKPVYLFLQNDILYQNPICRFRSIAEVQRTLNIAGSNVGACCKGKRKSVGGYRWKFVSDYLQES